MSKAEPEEISESNPVGGFAFYLSLLFLCFLAAVNTATLLQIQSREVLPRFLTFAAVFVCGYGGAKYLFPERFCVFVHELKHSIISNLAGNRAKKMKFGAESGSFTYQYTKRTAAYNAFIALAPYLVPLFTVVGLPFAIFGLPGTPLLQIGAAGLLFGADSALNLRDFSPQQTDITGIRGGYLIGALYIIAMNVTLSSILLAWVTRDVPGLSALVSTLWHLTTEGVQALRTGAGA